MFHPHRPVTLSQILQAPINFHPCNLVVPTGFKQCRVVTGQMLTADEEAVAFVDRALTDYTLKTGHGPTASALHLQVFRAAILKGVPKSVGQAMEANPDLPSAEVHSWVEVCLLVAETCVSTVDGLVIGHAIAVSDLKRLDGAAEAEADNLHMATIEDLGGEVILLDNLKNHMDFPQCQTNSICLPMVDNFHNDGARNPFV
ncbi:uncharacterized protein LOC144087448 [Stigmatopora argus]